jgi:transcription initiation factor TFIID TATA-box-binding protein
LTVQIQNVVASAVFSQTFDLKAIANAFPWNTEFKERFPGLVFRLEKPKASMLIFKTGKMVCTGAKSESEVERTIQTVVQKLKNGGINVTENPKIYIANIVASVILDGFIDLEGLYLQEEGRSIYEPDQFPAVIYRWESPPVVFLIFSTGKIVCVGAKKEGEIYETVAELQRRLKESKVLL